jgi:hypothetical protein
MPVVEFTRMRYTENMNEAVTRRLPPESHGSALSGVTASRSKADSTGSRAAESLPVKYGLGELPKKMTAAQARLWGAKNMPADLKRCGFQVCLFRSDLEIHGGDYFRVSFGK